MALASVYSARLTMRGCGMEAAAAAPRPERARVLMSSMRLPSSRSSKTAGVRQGPACSMQAEEGTGLSMIAPARGRSRYALVRDGVVGRGYYMGLGGGSGIRPAGSTAMMLIIGRICGGSSLPCARAAVLTSMLYWCRSSTRRAMSMSSAMLERTQNGRWCW